MELIFSFDYDFAQEVELAEPKDLCNLINSFTRVSSNEKPYLLIVNPRSGVKKGLQIYQNSVANIFEEFGIKYVSLMTEKPLHALNFIKSCANLSDYRGIVSVSGDGLVYEILCGFMERASWREDLSLYPIGIIAAGSGNGLAASVCGLSGIRPTENLTLQNILILKNPSIENLDLMKLQTSTKREIPSFLSFTWGLIANIDVGSDKFRWMGPSRFKLAAAIQIAKLKKFKAQLWYLPADAVNKSYQKETIIIPKKNSPDEASCSYNSFKYLRDFNDPLSESDGWVFLDEKFNGIVATLLPYLAADAHIVPKAALNDGKIHLAIIHSSITRTELLNYISKIETGQQINSQSVTFVECVAFRLVPECDKSLMAVDGEYLTPCAIQGEIMPSIARLFTGLDAKGESFI